METHIVEQGECMSSIADLYGFADFHAIYDHPSNAALKQKRPNPNVLYPGDTVNIPDKQQKEASCSAGQQHTFQVNRPPVLLRLRLQDDQGHPFANKKYRLIVDGVTAKGTTDGQGMLTEKISPSAQQGELILSLNDDDPDSQGYTFELALGHLDPVDEISGAQARLNNLGIDLGAIDGVLGPRSEEALQDFQAQMGLPVTGQADSATQAKLRELHDGS